MADTVPASESIADVPQLNQWLKAQHLQGFWEARYDETPGRRGPGFRPYLWKWSAMSTALEKAGELIGEHDSFRRNVSYKHPEIGRGTWTTISMGAQIVKPGERPAAHRHAMAALRWVIRGDGQSGTVVDGEDLPMEAGDLLTTPARTWHDHYNHSSAPVIWLDIVDAPLMNFLGVRNTEPSPDGVQPITRAPGATAAETGVVAPPWIRRDATQPPPYRYSWAPIKQTLESLAHDDADPFDGVLLEYRNPVTHGPTLPSISCCVQMLRSREATRRHAHSATAVYHVFSGRGRTVIDGESFEWETGDTFVVPQWSKHHHENLDTEAAYLFSVTDRALLDPFGLYEVEPA
ncbi:MAG: gentisate 1,2-dioxygenase [Chloroflexi bacterium]|nr:gentisate 1,2-dioxygenase [Chloroflexota bacterium]